MIKLRKKINHTKGFKKKKRVIKSKEEEEEEEDASPLGLICPTHWLGHEIEII
jgi:hypothetical protein